MNKAITDGLVLMPPTFAAGLNLWSREDGRPGEGSYAGQGNAAYVPNDQDFGGCMELQKVDTVQKLRCFQQIPFQPGMYLLVTVRIKALAGALPGVRIAAWAGRSNGTNAGVPQTGAVTTLTSYGTVRTITAIIGSGDRQGVDLAWGTQPTYAHIGLDLTGGNGGVVRIEDITIEDVTGVFLRKMMDWVDVRDYGAVGNGSTDDTAAFAAADTAAAGRTVIVSPGTFRIAGNLTLDNPVRFEGRVTMPAASRLICRRNFDLESYTAAFGSEAVGFRKALQALLFSADHAELNLNGRRVDLTEPVDVAGVVGLSTFEIRRVLKNGTLNAVADAAWNNTTVTSVATYTVSTPTRLTGVVNVANIVVGAHVTGTGVGREVYVKSKNVGAGTVELSQPLWAAAGTRTFTFRRYKYMLDFSGFTKFSKFEVTQVELQCNGLCSAILLPPDGQTFRLADCSVTKPKDRGITSHGRGCQDLMVDQCQFVSNEQAVAVQNRTTCVMNVNANDAKIRGNRVARFEHFAVLAGTTHMLVGNHIFQGDDEVQGTRKAGIVFTTPTPNVFVTGNYIDNCFIEMSNEHDPNPNYDAEYSFGGLTLTGNVFFAMDVGPWFRWLVVAPKGPGHFISGLSVTGNAFRIVNGTIDRAEKVDTTVAGLDYSRMRNVVFDNNTFNGVDQLTVSPVTVEHTQNTAADTWVIDAGRFMPFGGRARCVPAVVPEGAITNSGNAVQFVAPYALVEQGAGGRFAHLRWPSSVKGRAQVTVRCDTPV